MAQNISVAVTLIPRNSLEALRLQYKEAVVQQSTDLGAKRANQVRLKNNQSQRQMLARRSSVEEQLRQRLGTRVNLNQKTKGGTLTIYYYSAEELDTLLDLMLSESD